RIRVAVVQGCGFPSGSAREVTTGFANSQMEAIQISLHSIWKPHLHDCSNIYKLSETFEKL
ncbi:MAG: hypothetical protein PVI00_05495, partial [Desulfobacterales bacterium]